jgi:hypothetical protein
VLRRVYPEADLSGAAERLTLFLIHSWGGPNPYSQQPSVARMRHQPFAIGRRRRMLAPTADRGGRLFGPVAAGRWACWTTSRLPQRRR